MNIIAASKPSVEPHIREALEELARHGKEWGPGVVIDQGMVDTFTRLFLDPNPIHRADADGGPIVPGLMLTSMLSMLSPLSRKTEIAGRTVINKSLGACDFLRPVPVGATVRLRYALGDVWADRAGVNARFTYAIGIEPAMKVAVGGSISLLLLRQR